MVSMKDTIAGMLAGRIPMPPVARLIGFRMTKCEQGEATFELEAGPQHANPMGTLHGGILADVSDASMGMAYASTLPDGWTFTTIEHKINYMRPVWSDRLVAVGRVIKAGKLIALLECDITDSKGNLVAHATSTCMALEETVARPQR